MAYASADKAKEIEDYAEQEFGRALERHVVHEQSKTSVLMDEGKLAMAYWRKGAKIDPEFKLGKANSMAERSSKRVALRKINKEKFALRIKELAEGIKADLPKRSVPPVKKVT